MTTANHHDAIIFDFDGVLFDSEPLHLQAGNSVLSQYHILIDNETYFKSYVGMPDIDFFRYILNLHGHTVADEEITRLTDLKYTAYKRLVNEHQDLHSKEHVLPVLQQLSIMNKRIAICSSATRTEIDATLMKYKNGVMKPFFEIITTIDDVEMGKPSPQGYSLTSHKLGVEPSQCLVIEDTPIGIAAAKSAHMKVLGLVGTHPHDKLQQADRVIYQLTDIFN